MLQGWAGKKKDADMAKELECSVSEYQNRKRRLQARIRKIVKNLAFNIDDILDNL